MNRNVICTATYRLLSAILITSICSHCFATSFSFERITNNGNDNIASQLTVDVSDSGGRVLFKLSNSGPLASNVTEVYWDDDMSLLDTGGDDSPDVDAGSTSPGPMFIANSTASPGSLPGENAASFTTDYSIDSQNGGGNGINPGEMAGFLFDGNANAVIAAMQAGDLRIGMHVRSISSQGGSDGFVNLSVPEPTTLAMLTAGLVGLSLRRKHC